LIVKGTAQREISTNEGVSDASKKVRAPLAERIKDILNSMLSDARFPLPDFNTTQVIPIVGSVSIPVTLSVTNIECYKFYIDNLFVVLDPLGMLEANFNLDGVVRMECYMDSIQSGSILSDQGSANLASQNNKFDLVTSLSPTSLSFTTCSFELGTAQIDFSGSDPFNILDALLDIIVNYLDKAIGNVDICKSIFDESQADLLMPAFGQLLSRVNIRGGGRPRQDEIMPILGGNDIRSR